MGERKRRRRSRADGTRRDAQRFERVRVDAPPGLSAELAFPWASGLVIGSAPVPPVTRSHHAPPPRRKVAE